MYPQVEQNLKHIISVIERMTQLISELKAFASRHRVPKGSADVIKVMYSAVALLNHSMEKNNIERRIKPHPCRYLSIAMSSVLNRYSVI